MIAICVTRLRWVNSSDCSWLHESTRYSDVIMGAIASQITSLTIVYSTVHSGAGQRKYQSSVSLAFCKGNSPVTGEFPTQMARNAENVSIWWRHHVILLATWCITWISCETYVDYFIIFTQGVIWTNLFAILEKNEGRHDLYTEFFCQFLKTISSILKYLQHLEAPLTNMVKLQSQHGYVTICPVKCRMKLFIHSQTSTAASLKFRKE